MLENTHPRRRHVHRALCDVYDRGRKQLDRQLGSAAAAVHRVREPRGIGGPPQNGGVPPIRLYFRTGCPTVPKLVFCPIVSGESRPHNPEPIRALALFGGRLWELSGAVAAGPPAQKARKDGHGKRGTIHSGWQTPMRPGDSSNPPQVVSLAPRA